MTFPRVLALCRIFTGFIFILFGEYKLASPDFASGGISRWLAPAAAFPFYRPFLSHAVLAHPAFWGYFVGAGELAIGVSLVLGIWVRAASIGGLIEMLNLLAATGFSPGPHAPLWQYFGASLDHICPALLFVIFLFGRAGKTWGLDGKRIRKM
ncbi:MAG TPA: DoxX family protein [Terriglobia bacterium]|nr:DoxX family protein [Terriglobia bacterium]